MASTKTGLLDDESSQEITSESIFDQKEEDDSGFNWGETEPLEEKDETISNKTEKSGSEENSLVQDVKNELEEAQNKESQIEVGDLGNIIEELDRPEEPADLRTAKENKGRFEDYNGPISLDSIHHYTPEIVDEFTKWGIKKDGRRTYIDSEAEIIALDYDTPISIRDISDIIDRSFRESVFEDAPYRDVKEWAESTSRKLYLSVMEELESEDLPYLPVEDTWPKAKKAVNPYSTRTQMMEIEGYSENINLVDKLFIEIEEYLRDNEFRRGVADGFSEARKDMDLAYKIARMDKSGDNREEFKIEAKYIPESDDVRKVINQFTLDEYESFDDFKSTHGLESRYRDYQGIIEELEMEIPENEISSEKPSASTTSFGGQTATV